MPHALLSARMVTSAYPTALVMLLDSAANTLARLATAPGDGDVSA